MVEHESHLGLREDELWDGIGKHLDVFNLMPQFMKVLDGIISLQCKATCSEAGGCSIAGNRHRCTALTCIRSKGYQGCWQCGEFEKCDKLSFLKAGYGHVIEENLRTIKENGMEAVTAHGNEYYEWQRRRVKK